MSTIQIAKRNLKLIFAAIALAGVTGGALIAQQPAAPGAEAGPVAIPQTIRYAGTAATRAGDTVEAVFSLYAAKEGGEPLWSETQRVMIAPDGRYSVLLGSASEEGLPQAVFATGEARWLGVSIERGEEQPRTLLSSVAYAMKAADAETLSGRRITDFVTQEQLSRTAKALAAQATALALPDATLTGSGTVDFLPLWTGSSALGSSIVSQEGTTKIGIATKAPATTLDVNGESTLRGTISLTPPAATSSANSPLLKLSAFAASVAQNFAWGASAVSSSADLELMFSTGSGSPAATGLAISPKGVITFAKGQTFPGTGTIAGVTAGTALTGGGTTGKVTLNLDTTKVPLLASANTFTGGNTFSNPIVFSTGQTFPGAGTISGVTAGTALTGGGTAGTVTLNVDTAKVITTVNAGAGLTGGGTGGVQTLAVDPTKVVTAVTAGAGLTGGGTGGALTLTVDSTKVPLLAGANTFAGSNTFTSAVTFASGQSFPGAGTITGVTAGTALTGGGTTGAITLNVDTTKVVTAVNAGAGLTGGGTGGAQTLTVDPTKVPMLASANTFTGSDTFSSPITFAAGQTFPGTGPGTITGVTAGTALTGGGKTGAVTLNVDTTKVPLLNTANTFSASQSVLGGSIGVLSTGAYGISGDDAAETAGIGVKGTGGCCTGGLSGGVGIQGSGLIGLYGTTVGPPSDNGWGVLGNVGTGDFSAEGTTYSSTHSAGVWGDTTSTGDSGMMATADTRSALLAVNNTTDTNSATVKIYDYTTDQHDPLFETYSPNAWGPNSTPNPGSASRYCVIDTSANLECSGLIESEVANPAVAGKVYAMYAMQSPENWFEDFGSGTLQSGSAHVSLERIFGATVNSGVEYHVFLTPKGDCEGLYATNEGPEGFDVRELRHGKSSVSFDYRIVAKRKGYETVRMEDQTEQYEARSAREKASEQRMAEAAAHLPMATPRRTLRAEPAQPVAREQVVRQ